VPPSDVQSSHDERLYGPNAAACAFNFDEVISRGAAGPYSRNVDPYSKNIKPVIS